jgi:hypothetical protein
LDGSELGEAVLPAVTALAKAMALEVILLRVYHIPYSAYPADAGYATMDYTNYDELLSAEKDLATDYLKAKSAELKAQGVDKISYVRKKG